MVKQKNGGTAEGELEENGLQVCNLTGVPSQDPTDGIDRREGLL